VLDQKMIPKLKKQKTGNEDFRVELVVLNEAIKGVMSQYSETEQLRKSRQRESTSLR